MQVDPNAAQHAASLYQDLKFWIPIITTSGLFLKAALWVRNLATKEDLHAQTIAIVTSIEGMRTDLKTSLAPYPPRLARAKSAKRNVDKAQDQV